ncbi:MAG: 3'-5' exoribonuclease YhaM family protein [Desulfovibrio sp.]
MTKKKVFVRDLTPGTSLHDIFLIRSARLGKSRNGPYWNVVLQDCSGEVEAKIWNPLSQHFQELPAGTFVEITAQAGTFRDVTQLTIESMNILENTSDFNVADYMPASKVPPEVMMEQLEDLIIEHISYKPWKKFCKKVFADENIRAKFLMATGAKTVHHAYVGGLLEHTLSVATICMSMADLYPELDKQVLLVAAIFHDIGKAWELSGDLANDYTDEGRLLGHMQLGLEHLAPFLTKAKDLDPELKMHFKHLILSHHGEYEFGSPKRPKTPEAFVLHMADNMDAKLNTVLGAFDSLEGEEPQWTPYQRFLDRFLFRPTPTPDKKKAKQKAEKNQCMLPIV